MTGPAGPVVGREPEVQLLGQMLEKARAGTPQFVFVSGERGIGKTHLPLDAVESAFDSLRAASGARVVLDLAGASR